MHFVKGLSVETGPCRLTLPGCNFIDTWNILSPPPILLRLRIDLGEAFATGKIVALHTGCTEDAGVGASGESRIPPHGDYIIVCIVDLIQMNSGQRRGVNNGQKYNQCQAVG